MKKLIPLSILIVGLVLVFLGLEASDSFGSAVSEVINDAPSNKAIFLLVGGVLATVVGAVGVFRK